MSIGGVRSAGSLLAAGGLRAPDRPRTGVRRNGPLRCSPCSCSSWEGLASGARAAGTSNAPLFVLTGGGWGHGVGMSQWGAYGQARQGRTYRQILATYYPGTELTRTGAARVRVELAAGVPGGQVDATGVFVAADARGKHYRVTSRLLVLAPGLQAPLGKRGKRVTLAPPVTLTPLGATLLSFDGRQVRGALTVSRASARLSVLNELDLESYLLGVVPSEMPWAWPAEALKAQAIATRSYTVFSLATSRGKPYDVYADTRSQVYGGVAAESSTASAAVRATSGEILAYGGVVAQTPYFSSSGGRTESSLDVFGTAVPYLQAVADPWDAASPHHAWAPRVLTARGLAAAFGLRSRVIDVTEVSGATRPEQVVLRLAGGHTVSYDLLEVRDRLRLLSTGFRLGELLLEPSPIGPPLRRACATSPGCGPEQSCRSA